MSPRVRFSIAAGVVVVSILSLIGWALSGSTSYYKTPTELASGSVDPHSRVRVAGKVVAGSVVVEGATTSFEVSDGAGQIPVITRDLLPDTFGAGVEVVAEGSIRSDGVFSATTVLAKCPSKFKAKTEAAP